jgi:hypothetical protein
MYSDWVTVLPFLAVLILLLALTYIILRQRSFLEKFFSKSGEADFKKRFEEVIRYLESSEGSFKALREELQGIRKQGESHIQRVGLLRYNPYGDTGGDISFSAAFLDNKGNGFVLTSLHTRSGTRVFAKQVLLGKPEKYEFSKEESEVIQAALKNK